MGAGKIYTKSYPICVIVQVQATVVKGFNRIIEDSLNMVAKSDKLFKT